MRVVTIRLCLILAIAVALLIPALLTTPKYETPQVILDFAKMNNLGELTRIDNDLYITQEGQYLQRFPAQGSNSNTVEAAYGEYYGTDKDGHVTNSSTTYNTAYDAPTGTVVDTQNSFRIGQDMTGGTTYHIYRAGVFFDTSSINDNAIFSAGSLALAVGNDQSDVDFQIVLVRGDDLDSSGLVAEDYGDIGNEATIVGASATTDNFAGVNEYEYIGIHPDFVQGVISINSTTMLGLRSWEDIIASAPTGDTLMILRPDGRDIRGWYDNPVPGDNWDKVDDIVSDESSTYNWIRDGCSAGVGGCVDISNCCDTYTLEDPSGNTSTPNGVTLTGRFYTDWPTSSHMHFTVGVDGTYYYSSAFDPPAGKWTTYTRTWAYNPKTSLNWTWQEIRDLEAGFRRDLSFVQDTHRCTQFYISTLFTPAGAGSEYIDFHSYEQTGTTYDPYLILLYTIGNVPLAPTDLLVNDEEHPITADASPYFSAIGHHDDVGATMNDYYIQVDEQQSFASPLWDSGQTSFTTNITDGQRCENIEYVGLPLTYRTRYYWRIAFYDQDGDISPWSTTSWWDYDTPTSCPSNLIAEPLSHNEIRLTWDNAESTYTYGALYYKTIGHPATRSDGTRLYLGPGEVFTHSGLDAGTNYYYRVWGYDSDSGNYSTGTCYSSDWATTLAGETDGPTPPLVPPEWSQYPTCEIWEGVPFIHDLITDAYATNGSTTHYDVPDETACLLCTFGFLLLFGLTGYFVTRRNELVLVGILCVGIIAASIAGAMPMWFIAFAVVGAIYLFVKVRA